MRQFLFVVNNGRIAFWQFHRGCLSRRSLNGNLWNDYCPEFWDVWSEANQPEESEDVVLLSDRPDAYEVLPQWFHASDTQTSKWTLETFSKVVSDEEFAGKNVKIYLGSKKYDFSSGSPEEVFWLYPREGDLSSRFAAAKEKQIQEEVKQKQRAVAEELEKRCSAEALKKREEELARKHAEEERRAEEAKRAAEENRKREVFKGWSGVELPSAQMKNIKAVVSNSTEIDSALDDLTTWMGNDELKHFAVHRYGDVTSRIEKSQKDKRAAEVEKKRQADEARRVQEVFESGPVKQLFSAWERLCGAYSKILPALTYQLHQACRNCARGIVLPRNYLKDVALKFLSECASPSFQGRGVAESVKDRGAVLGILLLHYIGSSDFNSNGEEAEDLNQIYQLAQRQSIYDRLVAHIHKYLEI